MSGAAGRQGYRKSRTLSGQAVESGEVSRRIDALFAELDRPRHAGGVVVVLRGGEVVHRRGYGVADLEHDLPFLPSTVLRLGSTSKHMLATALLLLENRGALTLEQDTRDFVPELPDYGTPIRLRHLLTMTSGLPDGLSRLLFAGLSPRHPVSRAQILELQCRTRELLFRPGADCSYSNTNYNLLSLVVERTSGTTLRRFLRAQLFEPLGMSSTDLVPDSREVVPGMARGYQPTEESEPLGESPAGTPVVGYFPIELCGDGGIVSSADDLVRWLRNYRAPDARFGADYRRRIEAEAVLADGQSTGYALGLAIEERGGWRKVSHAGGMPGYLCDFALYEDKGGSRPDLGVIELWNWMDPKLLESADRIAELVLHTERPVGSSKITTYIAPEDCPWARGLYACPKTGELLQFDASGDELLCYYLGEVTRLERAPGGTLRSAKRSLRFEIEAPADVRGELELRFGAQAPRVFAPLELKTGAAAAPELAPYCGVYRSEELGEDIVVELSGETPSALAVRLPSPLRALLWRELRPVAADLFHANFPGTPSLTNVSAFFRRDETMRVAELVYATSRSGPVRFIRVADRSPARGGQ